MLIVSGLDLVVRECKRRFVLSHWKDNGAVHWDGERTSWEGTKRPFLYHNRF